MFFWSRNVRNSGKGKKGKKTKKASRSLDLRYNIWTQMKYEVIVAREYLALTFYKLKGWV